MPSYNVNAIAIVATLLAVAVGTRLMTLLPERYYFTFSQLVDSQTPTSFLAQPELPSPAAFCRILLAEGQTGEYGEAEGEDGSAGEACAAIAEVPDIDYMIFPSAGTFEGLSLVSPEYKRLMTDIVSAIRNNQNTFASALRSNAVPPVRSLATLRDEEIEALYTGSGGLVGVLRYIAADDNADVFQIAQELEQGAEVGAIEEKFRLALEAEQQLKSDPAWRERAQRYRDRLIEAEVDTIRGEIHARDNLSFWPAVVLKLIPALFAGVVVGWPWPETALRDAPIGAAMAAILLCWPVIVLWDSVVASEWIDKRNIFLLLYLAYTASYYFCARLGVMLAVRVRQRTARGPLPIQIEWNKVVTTALTTVVTSAATILITWSFGSVGR